MKGKESARRTSSVFSGACFIMVAIFAIIFRSSEAMPEDNEKSPLSPFNGEQLRKLRAGKPVCVYIENSKKEDAGYGQCSIIINAPIEKGFELLSDIENQVHYVPGKKTSKIVSRNGDKVLIENEYLFYGVTTRYHSLYTIDEKNHRLEWEIDKSWPHDLDDNSGSYQLEKLDEKTTLLTYGATKFKLGFRIPEFIKKFLLDRSLPAMAINIKKYLESKGEWRQED